LTDKGRELVERILTVHPDQMDTVMGSLTPEEQADLQRLLDKLGRHLEVLSVQGDREGVG
jgi:DNA-binding MarR family transcriptional regulator